MWIILPQDNVAARKAIDDLRNAVREQKHCGDVVLNLHNVDTFDDIVLAKMIGLWRQLQLFGRQLSICGLRPEVRNVMQEMRIDQLFVISG